jgi:hypothetical protein
MSKIEIIKLKKCVRGNNMTNIRTEVITRMKSKMNELGFSCTEETKSV